MSQAQQLMETWFRRVWFEKDQNAIDEMFPAPGEARGLGCQPLIGAEDFKVFHRQFCALVDDIEISIDKFIEQGTWSSVLITIRGTSKASGQPVMTTGNCFTQIQNGKIIGAYNHIDFMGLWGQLGFLPEDSLEQGLTQQGVSR